MNNLNGKKIAIIGFVIALLISIPVLVYFIGFNQENRSRAEKSTTLSFVPESTTDSPINKAVNEEISLDIMVNPGTNLVSFIKLDIQYDDTKLATAEADTFKAYEAAFPVTLEGPVYSPGKIAVTLSVGSDPTKAIQTLTKAATIKLKAIDNTGTTPTSVTYGNATEILSLGSNDEATENVLQNVLPAYIIIGTSSITPTDSLTPTATPTATIQPTITTVPTAVPTTVPTTGPTSPVTTNQLPVCTALNLDRNTTGTAPYAVTFTAVGNDPDGTISRVILNYGDGPVETVTETGGIGSNSISVQRSHTYNNTGTYTASATLVDNSNGYSDQNSCKTTITVQAAGGGGGGTGDGNTGGGGLTTFPTATMANTGPGDVFIGAGAIAVMMIVIGGLLFFVL